MTTPQQTKLSQQTPPMTPPSAPAAAPAASAPPIPAQPSATSGSSRAPSDQVREKLQRRAQRPVPSPATGRPAALSREETIQQYLDRPETRRLLAKLLGKWMSPDRLLALGVTVLRQNPELLSCEVPSLVGALVYCAQVRLMPGPIGHVYFAAFHDSQRGIRQVQPIVGYRGLTELARRSHQLWAIHGAAVRPGDYFRYRLGTQPYLEHLFSEDQPTDPNQLPSASHYYIIAYYRGGLAIPHVLTRSQVEWHRQFSRARDSGPWKTHYDAMALKTVIRDAAWRWLPLSLEGQYALALDEQPIESPEQLEAIPAEEWVVQDDGARLPVAPQAPGTAAQTPQASYGGTEHAQQLPF